MTKIIKSKIVGVSFRNEDGSSRQEYIRQHVRQGDPIYLHPMPIPEDKNAVAVLVKPRRGCLPIGRPKNVQVGHLSREMAKELHNDITKNRVTGKVLQVTGGEGKTLGVNIELIVK